MDDSYDVVVVGVPSASGALSGAPAHLGPDRIRTASTFLTPSTSEQQRVQGWYDYASGRTLAAGLRMADAGNLVPDRMRLADDLGQLPSVLQRIQDSTQLLVVLLGDDALSYYAHAGRSGALVHLDAHEDARSPAGEHPDHADFIQFLDRQTELSIAQLGLRGLVQGRPLPKPPTRQHLYDTSELRNWLDQLGSVDRGMAIDVDVLDPKLFPSVGSPVPDGWRPEQVSETVREVARGGQLTRISIAEFAPVHDPWVATTDAMLLFHLLVRAIDLAAGGD